MIHGIYLAAHGANAQSLRQDVIANNLANASTTAFKRDVATFQMLQPKDSRAGFPNRMKNNLHREPAAIVLDRISTDHRTAALEKTDREYDIALVGDGYLRVTDGTREFLTRNGQLRRSLDGELVMSDSGMQVLDTAGSAIQIPADTTGLTIGSNGTVFSLDRDNTPIQVGTLDLVKAPAEQLKKIGTSLYETQAELSPALRDVEIRQGFLEASGVNPVQEMASMIETSRAFEANVNLIRMQDESLGRLLQSVSS